MKCYNLDDIRTEINNYLAEAETKLKAWEAVTYPTKKDGKPFAAISRNINGANYHTSQYAKAVQAANTALEATLTDNGTRDTYAYNLIKDSVNC